MDSPQRRSFRRRLSIALHRWHRRIGAMASIFLIWMAVSGWLLNHGSALGLDHHQWHSPLLLDWYGIKRSAPASGFRDGGHWLASVDEGVVLDGKRFDDIQGSRPVGLVALDEMLVLADRNSVKLLSFDGELIDDLRGAALPGSVIIRLGKGCGGAVVDAGGVYFATRDGVDWNACHDTVQWARTEPLTAQQRALAASLSQPGISIERLLEDLHSGRFFGRWGPYLVDVVGGGLVLLAASGLWMFSHRRGRRRTD